MSRLHHWGIRRYQKSREKEALCRQLLERHASGRPLPRLDQNQRRKLQRYWRGRPVDSDDDRILLELLQDLEITPAASPESPSSDELTGTDSDSDTEHQDNPPTLEQFQMTNTPTHECSALANPILQLPVQVSQPESNSSGDGSLVREVQQDTFPDDSHNPGSVDILTCMPGPASMQPTHFNTKFMTMQRLCDLSQQYYNVKVDEYLLSLHGLNNGIHGTESESPHFVAVLSQNRLFWTKVKSGIYYLKMKNDLLARRELSQASQMIPSLCESQPFSFLKDMYATISPVASRVRPALRSELLRLFRRHSVAKLGPDHIFSEICRILCAEEGSDELSITALRAMLDTARRILPCEDPETFELQRTLVRLYRRNREFAQAEELSLSLIESTEGLSGETHVNSRLALTEYVYILNDQGRYEKALNVAEDVLHRAQRGLGPTYPDERSVYAMEDVAEICDKLGRISDSIDWLRTASRAALELLGNHSATIHILDKLEAMHEKRYGQVAPYASSY